MEDVCLKNAGPDDSPTTELSDEPCEDSNAYADDNGQDGQAVDVVIPLGGDDCTRTRDFYATPHIYLRWRTSRGANDRDRDGTGCTFTPQHDNVAWESWML